MKPLLCILLSCLCWSVYAQDSTIALSRFEVFTSQSNRILKTEARELGTIGARTVVFYKTTDLTTGESKKAVRLNWSRNFFEPLLIDPKTLNIDEEELDTLVDLLSRFAEIANTSQPSASVQYSYITGRDLLFTCNYDPFTGTWEYSMGKVYKYLRTCVLNTRYTFIRKRFNEWVGMIRTASTLKW